MRKTSLERLWIVFLSLIIILTSCSTPLVNTNTLDKTSIMLSKNDIKLDPFKGLKSNTTNNLKKSFSIKTTSTDIKGSYYWDGLAINPDPTMSRMNIEWDNVKKTYVVNFWFQQNDSHNYTLQLSRYGIYIPYLASEGWSSLVYSNSVYLVKTGDNTYTGSSSTGGDLAYNNNYDGLNAVCTFYKNLQTNISTSINVITNPLNSTANVSFSISGGGTSYISTGICGSSGSSESGISGNISFDNVSIYVPTINVKSTVSIFNSKDTIPKINVTPSDLNESWTLSIKGNSKNIVYSNQVGVKDKDFSDNGSLETLPIGKYDIEAHYDYDSSVFAKDTIEKTEKIDLEVSPTTAYLGVSNPIQAIDSILVNVKPTNTKMNWVLEATKATGEIKTTTKSGEGLNMKAYQFLPSQLPDTYTIRAYYEKNTEITSNSFPITLTGNPPPTGSAPPSVDPNPSTPPTGGNPSGQPSIPPTPVPTVSDVVISPNPSVDPSSSVSPSVQPSSTPSPSATPSDSNKKQGRVIIKKEKKIVSTIVSSDFDVSIEEIEKDTNWVLKIGDLDLATGTGEKIVTINSKDLNKDLPEGTYLEDNSYKLYLDINHAANDSLDIDNTPPKLILDKENYIISNNNITLYLNVSDPSVNGVSSGVSLDSLPAGLFSSSTYGGSPLTIEKITSDPLNLRLKVIVPKGFSIESTKQEIEQALIMENSAYTKLRLLKDNIKIKDLVGNEMAGFNCK